MLWGGIPKNMYVYIRIMSVSRSSSSSSSTKSIETLKKITMDNANNNQERYVNFLNVLESKMQQGNLNGLVAIANLSIVGHFKHIAEDYTLLTFAIFYGYVDAVKLLLKLGADPNQRDRTGYTPLCSACRIQYITKLKIIKLLMAHGADPTIGDKIHAWISINYLYAYNMLPLIDVNTECMEVICKHMSATSISKATVIHVFEFIEHACKLGHSDGMHQYRKIIKILMRFTNSKVLFDEAIFERIARTRNSELNSVYAYAYELYLKVKVQPKLLDTAFVFNRIGINGDIIDINKAHTVKTVAYRRYRTELQERVAKFKYDLENGRYSRSSA